ncbi:hypothetical protein [Pedobacter sp. NJ-S-72]
MPVTKATVADVPQLNVLVNSAYRGEESKKGWTTEADLLGGIRIDEKTLTEYFSKDAISILKYTTEDNEQILGSVYLEIKGANYTWGCLAYHQYSRVKELEGSCLKKLKLSRNNQIAIPLQ